MTVATHRASYRIPCDSSEQAERLVRSLTVESEGAPPRTSVAIRANAESLVVEISANDASGLRAATNSYLRWVNTALDVDRIAGRARTSPR